MPVNKQDKVIIRTAVKEHISGLHANNEVSNNDTKSTKLRMSAIKCTLE